jgi:DnaJ-class molecular chaperone
MANNQPSEVNAFVANLEKSAAEIDAEITVSAHPGSKHPEDIRICPECNGAKLVEIQVSGLGRMFTDVCLACDGTGVIEVEPIEQEDLPL